MKKLLLVLSVVAMGLLDSGVAMAAAEAAEGAVGAKAAIAIAAGLAIGLAAFGAALGQGRMAAAAMESIGRNPNAAPRIQLPMILGLAFIEALAIYALIIAFALQGKI
ncbi:MAG: ATP synthase F0 subunit C [Deltaproteobacteria bacterium]|jgi:F-type H+-transporting ATPase subunit c|nr:ATP synthase F0 subunit C [Deltaproteobacteria bacterium]MBI3060322.1 ATP synthase F0 subunit C [Deltaproteobacteria bacterium]